MGKKNQQNITQSFKKLIGKQGLLTIGKKVGKKMYRIRRVYKTQPGVASDVAKLVYEQAKIYRDAGHRGDFTVSYNGYTLPGEQNIVILEWQDESIQSPSRAGNKVPPEAIDPLINASLYPCLLISGPAI